MPPTDFDLAMKQQLMMHEGLRLQPYRCPAGKLTIGVGRNLDDAGIRRDEAMTMLQNDIDYFKIGLSRVVPGFQALSVWRRMALIDMAFNLGLDGLLKFKGLLAAIARGDFRQAAAEMLDSAWAKQVGQRAVTLADMMR